MRTLLVLFLLVLFGGELAAQKPCPSRPARPEDQSHGANEIIEQKGVSASKRIYGKVTDAMGNPIPNGTIIIVFRYSPKEESEEAYRLVKRLERFRAFLPAADGSYCITGLPPGRYLLQIGTLAQQDLNELFVRIRVRKPSARVRAVLKRNFELQPGT